MNFARAAKSVALLCFVLPWVTVSCAGQQLTSISGLDLATGRVSVRNPMTGAIETHVGSIDLVVVIAGAAIGLALLLSFLLARREAARAGLIGCGLAAVLICYEVFSRIPQQLQAGIQQSGARGSGFDVSLNASMGQVIRIQTAAGAWLVLLNLVAGAVLSWIILQRSSEAEVQEEGDNSSGLQDVASGPGTPVSNVPAEGSAIAGSAPSPPDR